MNNQLEKIKTDISEVLLDLEHQGWELAEMEECCSSSMLDRTCLIDELRGSHDAIDACKENLERLLAQLRQQLGDDCDDDMVMDYLTEDKRFFSCDLEVMGELL